MNLRKAAQGMPCDFRIPHVCTHNPEETVLCHIRRGGVAGMGQKPPDVVGAYGCSACHAVVDGRANPTRLTGQEIDRYILEALCRRLAAWWKDGKLKVAR